MAAALGPESVLTYIYHLTLNMYTNFVKNKTSAGRSADRTPSPSARPRKCLNLNLPTYKKCTSDLQKRVHPAYKKSISDLQKMYIRPTKAYIRPTKKCTSDLQKKVYIRPTKSIFDLQKKCNIWPTKSTRSMHMARTQSCLGIGRIKKFKCETDLYSCT